MAECIHCGATADSDEHWLPRTFGAIRDLEQLKERLCRKCNKELGDQLDQEVANTGTTALAKFALGIEGRHKAASKNPFQYRVMGTEAATTMLMDSPDGSHKILGQFFRTDAGEARAIALRQLVLRKANGELVPVQFPYGYTSERLRGLVKIRGAEGATLHSIYLDTGESHEDKDVIRIIREAVGPFADVPVYGGIGESVGRKDVLVSSNISLAYMRGIVKIAFHCYLAMSDVHTGAELLFQPVRRFIRGRRRGL
jgi:hypothetical protein